MKQLYLLIVIAAFIKPIAAQNVEFVKENFPKEQKDQLKDAVAQIEEGDKYFEMQRGMYYQQALEFYLSANKFNASNALLNYKIGKCYLNTIQKTKAIPYLEKAISLNPLVYDDVHYMMAKAYHLNFEFDKAIDEYKKYKQGLNATQAFEKGTEIEKKLKECETGKLLVKNPVRAFTDNLGPIVNSPYTENGPIVNADETVLYFTSRRPNTTGGKKDDYDLDYFEDIFVSYKRDGSWAPPQNPGEPLNKKNHDAIVGLSPDGQKLLIFKGEDGGDIYVSLLQGNNWSKPEKISSPINSASFESSASFTPDERTLYFVSDRPGGIGGLDIYKSTLSPRNEWMAATNLGSVINTPYDEEGIFVHPDGKTIFFSSNGHNTMGGYDIFKSVYENGKWSEPENLGYPINSPDDDLFFALSASGEHGYYSTVRPDGFGKDDIYMITFLGPEKQVVMNTEHNLLASLTQPVKESVIESVVEIKTNPVTILKGRIYDERTNNPLQASIELTDNEKNELLAIFNSNSASGKYLVSLPAGKNYGIAIKAEGFLFHSENFNIPLASAFNEVVKDIPLKQVEVGKSIVLNNIFFDSGKDKLRPESYAELGILRKLLQDNPTIKIEISGHTDNTGSDNLNQELSEKRAKAVVDYLIGQSIDAGRLKYAGYGKTKPIASNDTEAGRQQNRRTEFKITEK